MCPGCLVGAALWSGFWLTDKVASKWVAGRRERAMRAAAEEPADTEQAPPAGKRRAAPAEPEPSAARETPPVPALVAG